MPPFPTGGKYEEYLRKLLPGMFNLYEEVKEDPLKLVDIPLGILGIGPETKSKQLGELIGAGIPFPAGKYVFHGTGSRFKQFDPTKVNIEDLLGFSGGMHFAERPEYARAFTKGPQPQIRMSKLDVQDALDLIGGLDANDIERLRKAGLTRSEIAGIRESGEYGSSLLSEVVRRDPNLLSKTGHEAIRYGDYGNKPAWALLDPRREKLKAILDPQFGHSKRGYIPESSFSVVPESKLISYPKKIETSVIDPNKYVIFDITKKSRFEAIGNDLDNTLDILEKHPNSKNLDYMKITDFIQHMGNDIDPVDLNYLQKLFE